MWLGIINLFNPNNFEKYVSVGLSFIMTHWVLDALGHLAFAARRGWEGVSVMLSSLVSFSELVSISECTALCRI